MALHRYSKPVDGTIPIPALLYDDEELLATQDGVGIYDGTQKSPKHQSGTVHITSHRTFYIDVAHPFTQSFAVDLGYVKQTEYYAGLFKSSAKVTLHLHFDAEFADVPTEDVFESWVCEVCGNRNPSGLSPAAARICALCGVPRSSVPPPITMPAPESSRTPAFQLSTSFPASSPNLPTTHSSPPTPPLSHHARQPSSIACPACTFLNHPSLRACEICGTSLPLLSASTKSAPSSRPVSPMTDPSAGGATMMKLSFRKGGDKALYALLKRSLKSKAWEARGIGKRTNSTPDTSTPNLPSGQQRSGISGIMRTVESNAQNTETDMKDALQDLEALMIKAKDMVRLAAELNERLTASSSTTTTTTQITTTSSTSASTLVPSTEPEEATFIRSSLSQLGLQMQNAPVTLDMIRDERRWIEELARELARVLQGEDGRRGRGRGEDKEMSMMRERGIIALDEVWGGWNRARGVALIPPSTFLLVLPHLPMHTDPPIRARTFLSGLSVLHTPAYTPAAFTARLVGLLALTGPKTTMEIAGEEKTALALAEEMVKAVEADGEVCRDDGGSAIGGGGSGGGGEMKWWKNIFREYVWDGQDD